ncbi:hypothetical protein HANVADRAFT_52379 [Hanseniaspora valbyensis NRRL Y-1626]|uniref:Uncharacterized protein n=1 Tax=Hanseniaspora valbyensis NRRL Y-1626 TaxID=766949 RepID=A0A1B7TF35_9ASCO|nr:hypothetical protein HANVADRAFT_52379 [Hanseniaspora valbyensis NRRL Y-1626]
MADKVKTNLPKATKLVVSKKKKKCRPSFKIAPPIFQGFKKKYYCLYCKNSYKNTPKIVKNHISAHSHKINVKNYYLNKFLQLYDRSYLKSKGEFKLGNDINRFENSLLNNRKLGIQFENIRGDDEETGSNILSKIKLLNKKSDMNIPSFILRRRAIFKQKKNQKIKDKINYKKCVKNKNKPITNKDRQQLHEAKQILKQLNHKKQNSFKKYQIAKKRKKLLKILAANTDSNLNLNYNFGGDRKTKFDHSNEDNSLQILNHIYKKSPNYNRIFLSNDVNFNIWDTREDYINKFNENLKQKKLKSLKTKIAKVKKRIQIKRKYGKRKFNPKLKNNKKRGQSEDKKWLDKFNRKFNDETYLKFLKLKLKKIDNITDKRKLKFDKRADKYKLFNENIQLNKFLPAIQQEKNKYTNSLLLPPRTLNLNSNNVVPDKEGESTFITFRSNNKQKLQKAGPTPDWLLKTPSNKILSRRLFFPQKNDLEGIPTAMYNYLHKSKKLKHLIKQSLYQKQNIKSLFKYQGFLWKNYRKRNSFYKMNNNVLQKSRIIKLLQLKSMGKHWYNKIYGQREGKFKKLQRLTRYKEIRGKKLKYKKKNTVKSSNSKKTITTKTRFNNGTKIEPINKNSKVVKVENKKPIKKVFVPLKKPVIKKAENGKKVSRFDKTSVGKPVNRFQSNAAIAKISEQPQAKKIEPISRFNTSKPIVSRFNNNTLYQPPKVSNTTNSRFINNNNTKQVSRFNDSTTAKLNSINTSTSRFSGSTAPNTATKPIMLSKPYNTNNNINNKPVENTIGSRFSNTKPTVTSKSDSPPVQQRASTTTPSRFNNSSNQRRFDTKSYRTTNTTKSRFQG